MQNSFREAELAGWSTRPASYDQHLAPVTNQVIAPILEALRPLAGKKVLDVCCGPGHLAAAVAAEGATAQGVDFATSMVAKARENYPHVEFCQGDAEALAAANGAFDHVVCAFGVMHISRPEKAIAEAFRVLQPRGHYVFTQWALDDDLLKIATSAIADHGAPVDDLPDAPAPLRFSDPAECRRALQIAGFGDVRTGRIETAWTAERPEALLELIYGGAVRIAMVLEAQEPARRARIHAAIVSAAIARTSDGVVTIQRPVVMAQGTKPPSR